MGTCWCSVVHPRSRGASVRPTRCRQMSVKLSVQVIEKCRPPILGGNWFSWELSVSSNPKLVSAFKVDHKQDRSPVVKLFSSFANRFLQALGPADSHHYSYSQHANKSQCNGVAAHHPVVNGVASPTNINSSWDQVSVKSGNSYQPQRSSRPDVTASNPNIMHRNNLAAHLQVYTSAGGKPGPVTIPARSRSAQPSPRHSPTPRETFGSLQRSTMDIAIGRRDYSESSIKSAFHSRRDLQDDEDEPILPSVREIIRQVEALTEREREGRSLRPASATVSRASSIKSRPGILRNMPCKNNSIIVTAPPVPAHQQDTPKAASNRLVGNITRRVSDHQQPKTVTITAEYHKLREAFMDQRKEIQKLRKELSDKDVLIDQLQKDIRLYEPWR
ncbi:hypothetical protein Ciccas_006343 [Cichlidogyrus casuarinus]|uniref:Uncharacterized protein n=1 Tax=Cichlidogyrus casuarinus TaxID=1844966 RepID=A0ABD2Q9T8_9PLAT